MSTVIQGLDFHLPSLSKPPYHSPIMFCLSVFGLWLHEWMTRRKPGHQEVTGAQLSQAPDNPMTLLEANAEPGRYGFWAAVWYMQSVDQSKLALDPFDPKVEVLVAAEYSQLTTLDLHIFSSAFGTVSPTETPRTRFTEFGRYIRMTVIKPSLEGKKWLEKLDNEMPGVDIFTRWLCMIVSKSYCIVYQS